MKTKSKWEMGRWGWRGTTSDKLTEKKVSLLWCYCVALLHTVWRLVMATTDFRTMVSTLAARNKMKEWDKHHAKHQYLLVKFTSWDAFGLRCRWKERAGKACLLTTSVVDSNCCSCKRAPTKWCDALWVAQKYLSVMTAGSHWGCSLCTGAMSALKTGSSLHRKSDRHMADTQK